VSLKQGKPLGKGGKKIAITTWEKKVQRGLKGGSALEKGDAKEAPTWRGMKKTRENVGRGRKKKLRAERLAAEKKKKAVRKKDLTRPTAN